MHVQTKGPNQNPLIVSIVSPAPRSGWQICASTIRIKINRFIATLFGWVVISLCRRIVNQRGRSEYQLFYYLNLIACMYKIRCRENNVCVQLKLIIERIVCVCACALFNSMNVGASKWHMYQSLEEKQPRTTTTWNRKLSTWIYSRLYNIVLVWHATSGSTYTLHKKVLTCTGFSSTWSCIRRQHRK